MCFSRKEEISVQVRSRAPKNQRPNSIKVLHSLGKREKSGALPAWGSNYEYDEKQNSSHVT